MVPIGSNQLAVQPDMTQYVQVAQAPFPGAAGGAQLCVNAAPQIISAVPMQLPQMQMQGVYTAFPQMPMTVSPVCIVQQMPYAMQAASTPPAAMLTTLAAPEPAPLPSAPAAAQRKPAGETRRRRSQRGMPSERPCSHNSWDNVRVVRKKMTLRCRICQQQWRAQVELIWKQWKCESFAQHGRCPDGDACPRLHLHYRKQGLDERLNLHGSGVLKNLKKGDDVSPLASTSSYPSGAATGAADSYAEEKDTASRSSSSSHEAVGAADAALQEDGTDDVLTQIISNLLGQERAADPPAE
eukprot:TRINITY_DN26532_c0_g1_i1.p1 TRINITY_DN26532_c0_g1~~TRINITY_DN26532_c0_g1_i1.p1  ORF type:complete len:297 (+),score=69.31 TRINITY_DN26532_c0_g1_i1:435-1325(+)